MVGYNYKQNNRKQSHSKYAMALRLLKKSSYRKE